VEFGGGESKNLRLFFDDLQTHRIATGFALTSRATAEQTGASIFIRSLVIQR
jgi:hypothetical protein